MEMYLMLMRHLRQVWLYRRIAAFVTVVVAIVGWAFVHQMPDVYRADTRLYVDTASMLNRVLAGVALDSRDVEQEFLRVARRSLLSRPNLERIARETDMDLAATTPEARERILERLSGAITIQGESTRGRNQQENLFRLAFEHGDPDRALEVVQAVHDVFIESVLGLTRRDTEKMDTFLDRQIMAYERRLEEAEERRKRFRQANAGQLPGEGQNYFSMLHSGREQLRSAELNLTRAERVRDDLRAQLSELTGGQSLPALNEDLDPAASAARARTAAQARALEEQLRDLENRFTNQHPDVVAAQRQLDRLRAELGPNGVESFGQVPGNEHDRFRMQDLQTELARAQAAVASERATVAEYRSRMQRLEAQVNTIPEVEAELTRLNRDYGILRRQYEELVSRREAAGMSREADLTVDEGIFQVIEPPHVGTRPVEPDRPVLVSLVLGGALAAGGGVAFLLSLVSPTFGDVGQLRQATGVHVLGRVGVVRTRRQLLRHRLSYFWYGLLVVALLAAYAVVLLQFT